jgi:hypothetical protein
MGAGQLEKDPQWGFTNLLSIGDHRFDLLEGAPGICNDEGSMGEDVGDVFVNYDGSSVTITLTTVNRHYLSQVHFWIDGSQPLPIKERGKGAGDYQTSPGQFNFPLNSEFDTNGNATTTSLTYGPYPVSDPGMDGVWVAIHAVTCELVEGDQQSSNEQDIVEDTKGPKKGKNKELSVTVEESSIVMLDPTATYNSTTLSAYPSPFTTELNVDVNIEYEATGRFQLYDITGRLVETLGDRDVRPGFNRLQFSIYSAIQQGIYVLRFDTGIETVDIKVVGGER